MGEYMVLKPFIRETREGKVKVKPGTKINLELRSESARLLEEGVISRDLRARPASGLVEQLESAPRVKPPRFSPGETEMIKQFAEAAGFPMEGAIAQIDRYLGEDGDLKQALYLARKANKLLSQEEVIADAADEFHEDEGEFQADVIEMAKDKGLAVADVIDRIRVARSVGKPDGFIVGYIQDLVERKGMTPRDAMAQTVKDFAPELEPIKPELEIDPKSATKISKQEQAREANRKRKKQRRA